MVQIREADYPFVSIEFEGNSTLNETENYLNHFSGWLAKEQPFGLAIVRNFSAPEEKTEESKKAHELVMNWAKANRERVSQLCVSMAIVSDFSQSSERQQQNTPKTLELLFGCSAKLFNNNEAAKQWLQEKLSCLS